MRVCIFDIDNTLINIKMKKEWQDIKPREWKTFANNIEFSETNNLICGIFNIFFKQKCAVISTSRSEIIRDFTLETLRKYINPFITNDILFMRKENDTRDAFFVKQENLQIIKQKFIPFCAFDDDVKCIEMYESEGLKAIHV